MTIHRKKHSTFSAVSTPRWLGYAATAAATAALGHAQTAEASVDVFLANQTFDDAGQSFPLGKSGAYFHLSQFHSNGGGGTALANAISASVRGFQADGSNYASKLTLGEAIQPGPFLRGGGDLLAAGSNSANSQWQTPGTGYLGFRFSDADGAETGWAEITVSGAPDNTFTLDEYAYGTAGESLTAGEVPEPGSLALLALGGAGLLAWRQRRAVGTNDE